MVFGVTQLRWDSEASTSLMVVCHHGGCSLFCASLELVHHYMHSASACLVNCRLKRRRGTAIFQMLKSLKCTVVESYLVLESVNCFCCSTLLLWQTRLFLGCDCASVARTLCCVSDAGGTEGPKRVQV